MSIRKSAAGLLAAVGLAALGASAQATPPVVGPAAPPAEAVSPAPPAAPRLAGRLQPGQPIPPAELEAFLDGVVRDAMATDHVPGVTVSVVQGGRPILIKGWGYADLETGRAVDPARDLFRIASVSKTFTWILLMREVEAGRMKLDAPMNDYLPGDLKIPDQGFKTPVRVIDMLSHAGGFEDTALGHIFAVDPAKVPTLHDSVRDHRPDRVREPGLFSTYCNWCTAATGYAVARSAGAKDFESLAERDLFAPLGMLSTTFRQTHPPREALPTPMPAMLSERLAKGYRWTGSGYEARPFELSAQAAAGSVSTTASDMARYMQLLLNGGTLDGTAIYGPQTAQAFRTPILQTPEGVNGWAHGFMVGRSPGGFVNYGHGGALSNFFTYMMVIPELDLGVFVSTNSDRGRPLVMRLPAHVVERWYAPPPAAPLAGDPSLAERAGRYTGAYLGTRRAYTGLEGFVYRFVSSAQVSATSDGRLVVAGGGEARAFAPQGEANVFRSIDGRDLLTFDVDAAGRATGWRSVSGTQSFERAQLWETTSAMGLAAALGFGAAGLGIAGAFTRVGRAVRPTVAQARSNLVYLAASAAWLGAGALLVLWLATGGQSHVIVYSFPGPVLTAASLLAALAALGTLGLVALLWSVWSGGRRGEGWSLWRKLRHTAGVASLSVLSLMVLAWGGLQFWSPY